MTRADFHRSLPLHIRWPERVKSALVHAVSLARMATAEGEHLTFFTEDIQSWEKEKPAHLVVDFIAGMTDSFFVRSFEELFLPRSPV